jgi:DNA-binding NarL/FixJ family response regulator
LNVGQATRLTLDARVVGESEHLTPRQAEILTLLVRGDANKAIAAELGISERCVKWHLTNVYRKLSVESRTAAVASALRKDLR